MQTCPNCGSDHIDRDSVDIGVGWMHGPYGCYDCGWSEYEEYDCSNGPCKAQSKYTDRFVDQFGSAHFKTTLAEDLRNRKLINDTNI